MSYTLLYGSENGPVCSLLQVGPFKILLDCGWDTRFDESIFQEVIEILNDVDFILLSHGDLRHLGGLPYLYKKVGLTIPIFATTPVYQMGQMALYDAYQTHHTWKDFPNKKFNLDDVDEVFALVRQVNTFGQIVERTAPSEEDLDLEVTISLTPACAGHSLGGTIWKITKDAEDYVYAVDYNHKKDTHLNGAQLLSFIRPSLFITDSSHYAKKHKTQKQRKEQLNKAIINTLRRRGSVLCPVNAADRVLELLLLMEQLWNSSAMKSYQYSLVFLSKTAKNTIDFAQGFPEWLSDTKMKAAAKTASVNPFDFKHVQFCRSMADLAKLPKPYVVFATGADLEAGFAQDVFLTIHNDPKSLLLFTDMNAFHEGSLSDRLMTSPPPSKVTFSRRRNVKLEGKELEQYLETQRLLEEQRAVEAAELEVSTSMGGNSNLSEITLRDEDGLSLKKMKLTASFPMFPCIEITRQIDAYGDVINPDEYDSMLFYDAEDVSRSFIAGNEDVMEDEQAEAKQEDESETNIATTAPTKTIAVTMKDMPVACEILYVNFEGRSDGVSMEQLFSKVLPRQLVIINGPASAKDKFKAYITDKKYCPNVQIPVMSQTLDITSQANSQRLGLHNTLVSTLGFQSVGDCRVAFAQAAVAVMDGQKGKSLVPLAASKGHDAVFLGDLKMTDLQRQLRRGGVQADIVDGILVCANGKVNIRKVTKTRVALQGALCGEYYTVRKLLYGQFNIV